MNIKTCQNCGKQFTKKITTSKKDWEKIKYCSQYCYHSIGREEKECPICKKIFSAFKSHRKIYCSMLCKNRSRPDRGGKIINTCKICGKEYTPLRRGEAGKKQEYCSRECRVKGKSKENHWNWKGGIAKNHRRETQEYLNWRNSVYKKDRYTCRKCGKKCRKEIIVAHHIKSWEKHPKLRFKIENGIVLCRSCHKRVHKEIGYSTRFKKQ